MSEAPVLQEPTFAPEAQQGGDNVETTDYFGFSRTDLFYMPGSNRRFWIEIKPMNEGEKKNFQDKTSRDMVVERGSGNARMTVLQGTERHELIRSCIVNWNLHRAGEPVPCDPRNIGDFLTLADPMIVEELEKAIRKLNPWLLADMKVEDIDKEIENLQDMRKLAVQREAGEGS